jgi:hypothetical protein
MAKLKVQLNHPGNQKPFKMGEGYSTIEIETTGEGQIRANGFLKSEVTEMKKLILSRIEQ